MKHHLPAAKICGQQQTGPGLYLLEIKAPEIAALAQPGQFVHIRVTGQLDPLLRRPLSICGLDRKKGLIRLWYQVVGKGTELLSVLSAGDTLDVIGPLGRGFDVAINGKRIGLIGGGMGSAPLLFLGAELAAHNNAKIFLGARNSKMLPPTTLLPPGDCQLVTEDGSAGEQGLVTELSAEWLKTENPDRLYACGPKGMLAQVVGLSRQNKIPLQISLEATMACGVGACLGCTCGKSSADKEQWLKACLDGPVFWEQEVEL